jgi:hypothetical protein
VGPRAGLDAMEKIKNSLAPAGIEPGPSILYHVAIPTELSRLCIIAYYLFKIILISKTTMFWDVTSFSSVEVHRRLIGTYSLHM